MSRLAPTRTNLLMIRSQISDALRGCNVLKEKRHSLLREFMAILPQVIEKGEALENCMSVAYRDLIETLAHEGPEVSNSCALAAMGQILVGMETTRVMGVQVPKIKAPDPLHSPTSRGYHAFGTSLRIQITADRFENVLHRLLQLAAVEIQLTRLGDEIRKTNRRVNSLEQIIIPNLHRQRRYIQMVLSEREREDIFRLRHIKRNLDMRPV